MKKIILIAASLISFHALAQNAKLNAQDLVGQYTGTCSDQYVETTEALYINAFKNFNGETQILPVSTLQFYGGFEIPKNLKHLTTGAAENLKQVARFVRKGFTGVDNNQGLIGTGADYAYVYSAELSADQTALTLKVSDVKMTDSLTAPILRACAYGLIKGAWLFEDCYANNDQTVFKKNTEGQLVSLRTADERVKGTNNLSFRLPAIQKSCSWTKIN